MVPVESPAPAVTELLRAVEAGRAGARDELTATVHAEMRRAARRSLSGDLAVHLVSPTELVHGAALKLMVQQRLSARDRARFVAFSAQVMRKLLIDHLRGADVLRGDSAAKVTLVSTLPEEAKEEIDLDALQKAMERLTTLSTEHARLVELRYFGGMTLEEIAEIDGASIATVQRSWRAARAWLHDALETQREPHR